MLKKLIAGAFLLFSNNVHGEAKNGLYFGFGVGDVIDSFHFRAIDAQTVSKNVTRDSVVLNAFAGFGYTTCTKFFLAAELGTTFPERSIQVELPGVLDTNTFFVNELCVRDYLTGDLLVGYRPCPQYLYYVRGGGAFTFGRIFKFANTAAAVPEFDYTEKGGAWRVGTGFNYSVNCHLGFGLDYIFTGYPTVSFFTQEGVELRSWVHANHIAFSTILTF